MPTRQFLLGIWMLTTGLVAFAAVVLAAILDDSLGVSGTSRWLLWGLVALLPTVLLLGGWWLERQLLSPVRHLHVQLTRLVANPDARDDLHPEGWLRTLGQDMARLRQTWQADRDQLATAHQAGAHDAERIRNELEAVLEVLDVPFLLCDHQQRVVMLNPAAKAFFHDHPGLGLGRHLKQLLPMPDISDTIKRLPEDGSPRQRMVHHEGRWLRCDMRRVRANHGEALITLSDASDTQHSHQRWRQPLAELFPQLRGHAASLTTTASALSQASDDSAIRPRLEQAMAQESQQLGALIDQLSRVLEAIQLDKAYLSDTWSNDLVAALSERGDTHQLTITGIGIPTWFRADSPTLLTMLDVLLPTLSDSCNQRELDVEFCLGNKRVYLDLIWRGKSLSQQQLARWHTLPLNEEPLAPRISDVLRQHNSDWWSLADDDGEHARLRIPLPTADRVAAPERRRVARPEYHDFSLTGLPDPEAAIAQCPLRQLEMAVFDTETTGLKLRDGDRVISIGACRIIHGRLLAEEQFDQLINPQRAIPEASTAIHGIRDEDVTKAPPMAVVLPRFRHFVGDAVLVAHNAAFDLLAIDSPAKDAGVAFDMPVLDTLLLSRALDPDRDQHSLDALAEHYQIPFPDGARHTALGDARVTAELLLCLLPRLEARGVQTLQQALTLQASATPVAVG